MSIKLRLAISLLSLCFIIINCNTQNIEIKEIQNYLSNGTNILFAQYEGSQIFGDLILYNINNRSEIVLYKNLGQYSEAKLLNNGNDLVMFADDVLHKGNFYLIHLQEATYQKLSIKNRLEFRSDFDFISKFTIYNDSTIIFGFRNEIYKYSVYLDSLSVIKKFENKLIDELVFDVKNKRIFFTYQIGLDSIKQKYLGIYSINSDSILLTTERVNSLGNCSPDGRKLAFSSFYGKSCIYELENNVADYFEFKDSDWRLEAPFFIDDNTLLLTSFKATEQFSNLYLYDLDENIVKEKLTDSNFDISVIYLYNN